MGGQELQARGGRGPYRHAHGRARAQDAVARGAPRASSRPRGTSRGSPAGRGRPPARAGRRGRGRRRGWRPWSSSPRPLLVDDRDPPHEAPVSRPARCSRCREHGHERAVGRDRALGEQGFAVLHADRLAVVAVLGDDALLEVRAEQEVLPRVAGVLGLELRGVRANGLQLAVEHAGHVHHEARCEGRVGQEAVQARGAVRGGLRPARRGPQARQVPGLLGQDAGSAVVGVRVVGVVREDHARRVGLQDRRESLACLDGRLDPPVGQPEVPPQAQSEDLGGRLGLRLTVLPGARVPISPRVRSRTPTRYPPSTRRAIVPPALISASSGWAAMARTSRRSAVFTFMRSLLRDRARSGRCSADGLGAPRAEPRRGAGRCEGLEQGPDALLGALAGQQPVHDALDLLLARPRGVPVDSLHLGEELPQLLREDVRRPLQAGLEGWLQLAQAGLRASNSSRERSRRLSRAPSTAGSSSGAGAQDPRPRHLAHRRADALRAWAGSRLPRGSR